MTHIEHIELSIADGAIHCAGCEARIERALGREPGVRRVRADHTSQRVSLTVDGDLIEPDGLRSRLSDLGFPAS